MTVKERETAEFKVELSHDNVQVTWYKNDKRLHPSKVVHMSDDGKVHTLSFKEVSIDDTALIKAEALGKTSEAMLTVLGEYVSCSLGQRFSHCGLRTSTSLHQGNCCSIAAAIIFTCLCTLLFTTQIHSNSLLLKMNSNKETILMFLHD